MVKVNRVSPTIIKIVNFIDAVISIFVGGIALYLYVFKRKDIASLFDLLLNFSFQKTINGLNTKLENLNDFNVDDSKHRKKVINIFGDIEGQLKGNKILALNCKDLVQRLSEYIDNPESLTNPKKRSLTSELRERIDNISIQNYFKLLGDKHE